MYIMGNKEHKCSEEIKSEEKKEKSIKGEKYRDIEYINESEKIKKKLKTINLNGNNFPYEYDMNYLSESDSGMTSDFKCVEFVVCNINGDKSLKVPVYEKELFKVKNINPPMMGGKKTKEFSPSSSESIKKKNKRKPKINESTTTSNVKSDESMTNDELSNENIGDTDSTSSRESKKESENQNRMFSSELQNNIESSDLYRLQKRIFNSITSADMLTTDTETLEKAIKLIEKKNKYSFNKNVKYH